MLDAFRRRTLALAVTSVAVLGVGVGGVAVAATTKHAKKHTTAKTKKHAASSPAGGGSETALTGDTLASAKAAAEAAVPGGTVWRASTENPSDTSGAAYEVHVTKSDGSEVEVLLDSSFKVLATNASRQHAGDHGGAFHPNENGTHEGTESAAREAQEVAGQAPTVP
jgi:uncharacterized membrane protein YkoI